MTIGRGGEVEEITLAEKGDKREIVVITGKLSAPAKGSSQMWKKRSLKWKNSGRQDTMSKYLKPGSDDNDCCGR